MLVLLDQHGQQQRFEGQQVRGIGGGGQVMAGGGQQVVEGELILAAQGAAEAAERFLLGEKGVGNGRKRAAHGGSGPRQAGLNDGRRRRRSQQPGGIGGGLQSVEQRPAILDQRLWFAGADDHRTTGGQTLEVGNGRRQQALGVGQGDALVIEGGQQLEDEERLGSGRGGLDQLGQLEAGEGARQAHAAEQFMRVGWAAQAAGELPRQAGDVVAVEAVAAVEDAHRLAAAGERRGDSQQRAGGRLRAPEERQARLRERFHQGGVGRRDGQVGAGGGEHHIRHGEPRAGGMQSGRSHTRTYVLFVLQVLPAVIPPGVELRRGKRIPRAGDGSRRTPCNQAATAAVPDLRPRRTDDYNRALSRKGCTPHPGSWQKGSDMTGGFDLRPVLKFVTALKRNNNRAWFEAHRTDFEVARTQFENYVAALIAQLSRTEPLAGLSPKDCIFRLNRDLRFTKDRTPYKPYLSAYIAPGGRKSRRM
ncbi:MAG: DUF2461 domain-containing protein, partial [Chloroflexi bacterium]|nr:DUF2461 domain-containing protein [Chloroflexota bacterium]